MKVAFRALELNNRGRVLALLKGITPTKPGDADLRGWEWRYLWKQTPSDELFHSAREQTRHPVRRFFARWKIFGRWRRVRTHFHLGPEHDAASRTVREPARSPGVLEFSSDGRHLANANFKDGLWLWDWNPPHLTFHGPPPNLKVGVNGIDVRDGIVTAVDLNRQSLRRWDLTTLRELPGFPIVSRCAKELCGLLGFFLRWPPWLRPSRPWRLLLEPADGSEPDRTAWERCDELSTGLLARHRLIVAGSINGTCDVWETETFQKVASFSAHASQVDKGNFSRMANSLSPPAPTTR